VSTNERREAVGVSELDTRREARAAQEEPTPTPEPPPDGQPTPPTPLADATAPDGDDDPAEEQAPTPPMQIALPGTWEGIGTEFGGKAPDRSEIRLLGGKMPLEGSFAKGTEIDLHVRVKVTGVLGQDVVDAFGTVEGTTRRHMARMISVRRVDASALPSLPPAA
jgi:hypothetical protein